MNPPLSICGKQAVLATMHGKERVIVPLLQGALGVQLRVPVNFDTDRFGTFSREVERSGTQLDAARAKIDAAFQDNPRVTVGVASEGSFGPHPLIPFVPLGREIVVLIDRETGLELLGHHASNSTHFRHAVVHDVAEVAMFAERIGFPEHGLIVAGSIAQQPAPDRFLSKNVATAEQLRHAVGQALKVCDAAFLETDMRAHRNPTRMRAIKRATLDLVRRFRSACPVCCRPGFVVTERLPGLPCSWCGQPTRAIRAEVKACAGCGHQSEQLVAVTAAQSGECDSCNP